MSCFYWYSGVNEQNRAVILVLFLSIFSVVIADPELSKELNNELLDLNVTAILNEKGNWRKGDTEQQGWRKSDNDKNSNVRWGAVSIYEDTKKLPPGFTPTEADVEPAVDSRKAATQFKLKF